MRNGFNGIAFFYDELARLFFGNSITISQKYFLDKIHDRSTVLILGGGTGWLLKELLEVNQYGSIYYIEASSEMIAMAKAKTNNDKRIAFIHGTEDNIPASIKFDIVITNFYLDLFSDPSLKVVITKIGSALAPHSNWIATDFVCGTPWWQRVMLWGMYRFFKIVAKVEAKILPDWNEVITSKGFVERSSRLFYKGFIKTSLYNR